MNIDIQVNYVGKSCTHALFSYHHLLPNSYAPHWIYQFTY